MTDMLFTLTDHTITVRDGLEKRPATADEAEMIRQALEAKRLPLWLDLAFIVVVVAAFAVAAHGGGPWR